MGIFDKIKNAIFGDDDASTQTATAPAGTIGAAPTPVTASVAPGGTTTSPVTTAQASTAPSVTPTPTRSASAASSVDVAAILDKAVASKGQKLDWRHSIVDMMKALGMDASLAERKELAEELNYQGDINDSAKMNTFLHKALLQKLAENGGTIPADLTD